MKHLAAYLLLNLAGKTPNEKNIKSLLDTVGIEADSDRISDLLAQLDGKDINELAAIGSTKLATVPAGGGGVVSGGGGAAASAPLKKRRISTSPFDERRVSINEPLKKIKQENINNNVSPGGNNNNNNNLKSEPFSPKMSQQQQQSKASGSGSSPFTTRQIGNTGSNITHSSGQTINTTSNILPGELQNLSQTLTPDFTFDQSLRKKFLDPAINALFRTMKKELEDKDKMIENLQSELDGVKFTTNSITGQKLVAKLKALQEENEELGRQLRQGRVEQYEVEIAMQRKLINELKHGVEEYESKIITFDSEIEHLQDLIFQIQSKLKQYQNKYGPLVPENNKEKENVSKIATTTTNNNTSKSDIGAVTEEIKRDVHSQRMDEG
ncbi:2742_t:CDS:2 [Diversispora eburnea]|uniref:2742_t:CDS:1 n=1 Tax=Diversispora eburnea TaxID=1213867 RepID=A0A9N8ZRR8_9GLOM|nr:2742_t:CDS:2 [Diversispora eburnea]